MVAVGCGVVWERGGGLRQGAGVWLVGGKSFEAPGANHRAAKVDDKAFDRVTGLDGENGNTLGIY